MKHQPCPRKSYFPVHCPECREPGAFHNPVPGIVGHGNSAQRCDYCKRFASDEAARDFLRLTRPEPLFSIRLIVATIVSAAILSYLWMTR